MRGVAIDALTMEVYTGAADVTLKVLCMYICTCNVLGLLGSFPPYPLIYISYS